MTIIWTTDMNACKPTYDFLSEFIFNTKKTTILTNLQSRDRREKQQQQWKQTKQLAAALLMCKKQLI